MVIVLPESLKNIWVYVYKHTSMRVQNGTTAVCRPESGLKWEENKDDRHIWTP